MSDRLAHPQHRVATVKQVLQSGPTDCGLIALEMVLAYHGAANVRPLLRQALGYGSAGATVYALVSAARASGFDADAFSLSARQLDDIPWPAILHWRGAHYVVLEGRRGKRYSIVDPASGRQSLLVAEFAQLFSGVAVAVAPIDTPRSPSVSFLAKYRPAITVVGRDLWFCAFALIALWTFAFVSLAQQIATIIDGAPLTIPASLSVWWAIVSVAIIVLSETALGVADRRAFSKVGAWVAQTFAAAVRNAPVEYLTSRAGRFLEYALSDADPLLNREFPRLTRLLRGGALPVLVGAIAFRSLPVAAAVVLVLAVHFGFPTARSFLPPPRRDGSTQLARSRELLRALVARPEDLQSVATLGRSLDSWLASRGRSATVWDREAPRLVAPHGLALMTSTLVPFLAILRELTQKGIQFGDGVALLLLTSASVMFSWSTGIEFVRLRSWLARVAQLREIEKEGGHPIALATRAEPPVLPPAHAADKVQLARTRDSIPLLECRGIACEEAAGDLGSLSDVDFAVYAGQSLAIVGENGSGKTLLTRLVLGLQRPSRGHVLLLGDDHRELEEPRRAALITGMLDDVVPMDGTIGELFRSRGETDEAHIARVCAVLGLDQWLATLPLGLHTPITRGGAAFATHERRRLCLARIVLPAPRVVVLDATLDALDRRSARRLAHALTTLVDAVVLLTAHTEIVPPSFRGLRLTGGRLVDLDASLQTG